VTELPDDLDNYWKFSVVRNPWDRMVSLYHNFHPWEIPEEYTFTDFIKRDRSKDSPKLEYHVRPQVSYFAGLNIDDFNLIEFRNLKSEWLYINKKFKLHTPELEHRNSTSHGHYTTYYNDETKQIILDQYKEDIKMFGYTFGGEKYDRKCAKMENRPESV